MARATRFPLLLALFALLVGACAAPASPALPTATLPLPSTLTPTTAPTAVPTAAATATAAPTTAPTTAPIELTDSLGREVSLAAPAKRIISLAPSNTEILFALDAGKLMVARDEYSDYPPEAQGLPSVGSGYPTLNTEAIVSYQPDLVLAGGITNPDDVKAMERLGLTVYTTSISTGLDDIYKDIRALGQLTGHDQEAEALVADMQTRIDAVTTKTSAAADKPLVFYEIDATDPSKPYTAGANTFIDQIITLAGGQNVGRAAKDAYAQFSLEELVAQNPAIIVLGSATYGGQTPEMVAARPGWQSIDAVKNKRVYSFDDNLVSRPGPRVAEGIETMAKLIHPELFK
jgi:iron complex transport system substrate-binding protein